MKNACILLALLVPLGLLGVACDDDDSSGSDGQGGSGQSGSGGSSGSAQAGKAGASGSSAGAAGSSAGQGGSAGSGGSSGAGQGGSAGSAGSSAGSAASSAGQGGSSAGQGGSSQGGEGGSSQGGAGQGGSGGQAAKSKQGSISVGVLGITEVTGLPAPIVTNTASASFFDTSGSGGSTGGADCQKEEFGDCQFITCTTAAGGSGGSAGSGGSGSPTFLNAGDITITGGAVTPIVLKQKDVNGTTTYQPDPALPTDKPILVGGEAMEVKAPGKDVPAFTLQATAPKSPKIEGYPVASSPGASVDIDTTKDLELKISDGGEGNLTVLLSTASNNNKSSILTCTKPATSASLVISSAALKKVQAADSKATLIGALSVTKTTDVDDWSISLNLNNILRDKDNKPLSAFAQLNLK